MLGFQITDQTLRLAKAIGDPDITLPKDGEAKFFVYFEEDDTYEVIPYKEFKERYSLSGPNFRAFIHYRPPSFTSVDQLTSKETSNGQ